MQPFKGSFRWNAGKRAPVRHTSKEIKRCLSSQRNRIDASALGKFSGGGIGEIGEIGEVVGDGLNGLVYITSGSLLLPSSL